MNSTSRQATGGTTELRQPDFMNQSLPQSVYLLERSLDRYGYFKDTGAPGMLVRAERRLIRRQLQFLFNLRAKLTE